MSERRRSREDSRAVAPRGFVARDTIVAIATPLGRSAVSILRVSGADAERIVRRCVTPWPTRPRELTRCAVHAPDAVGEVLDDAMVALFAAPRSYTGETVVEIHAHGGTYIPVAIQAALVAAGARAALPGEFTERATRNGKLDLIRAEAIGELIDARTRASHRAAVRAVSGTLTRQYAALRSEVIEVEALIAYEIDFPDEDHGPLARERVAGAATTVITRLDALLATAPAAELAQRGALVVLAGPPNAGKSSLFNAFVGEERVIVSAEPGTTRDAIEVLLDTAPWPIRLVDTAGLRDNPGTVERLGIEVSQRYLKGADVVLACSETPEVLEATCRFIRGATDAPVLPVLTKADLGAGGESGPESAHAVSALTGGGMMTLRAAIGRVISERAGDPDSVQTPVSSARQRAALTVAREELELFRAAWHDGVLPAPVVATHVRAAVGALDHLIGAVDVDDVFSRVFATFCVGK